MLVNQIRKTKKIVRRTNPNQTQNVLSLVIGLPTDNFNNLSNVNEVLEQVYEPIEGEYDYLYEMDENIVEHIATNFENHIERYLINKKNDTRKIYSFEIGLLMNLMRNKKIEFSEWNRLIDLNNIERFEDKFDPSESTPIILALRKDTNKIEILDGQHRLSFLENKFHFYTRCIDVDIRLCFSAIDFKLKLDSIRSMNFNADQLIYYKLEEIKRLFTNKYSNISNNLYGNQRPKLNKDKFFEMIKNSQYFLSTRTGSAMVLNRVLEVNKFLDECMRNFDDIEFIYLGTREEKAKLDIWKRECNRFKFYLQLDGTNFTVLNLLINEEPGEKYGNWLNILKKAHASKKGKKIARNFDYIF